MSDFQWHTVYDPQTGEITGSFVADAGLEADNTPPGKAIISGRYFAASAFVRDAAAVLYSADQAIAKSQKPTYPARWSNESMSWVDLRDPVTVLTQAKARKWAEIKAAQENAIAQPITLDGMTFDADETAVKRIAQKMLVALAYRIAGQAYLVEWTLADNTTKTIRGADLIELVKTIEDRTETIRGIARDRRMAILAATTVAEVDAIHW